MVRYCGLMLMSVLSLTPRAAAEGGRVDSHGGSLQQQRACRPDVIRHCRDMQDQDDAAMLACLRAHERQLRPACRKALNGGE